MNTEAFEQWMRARGYRSTTVTSTLREVRRARAHWSSTGALLDSVSGSLRRFASFLEETGGGPELGAFERAVWEADLPKLRQLRSSGKARKRAAKSFSAEDWKLLKAELERDESKEGIVLRLMADTGHRVGDILRIPRRALQQARSTGVLLLERKGGAVVEVPLAGATAAWDALWKAWKGAPDDLVADWVCPDCADGADAGGGAYKRVQRHLARLGNDLGLSGRVHLHRLRRTVGVRALALTRDVHLVSQLLGHKSLSATERYVDEVRRDEVAELQKKLRGPGED